MAYFIVCAQGNDSITVYIFLSETCPICQSQTLQLRELHNAYSKQGIEFVGLFPNITMSNEASIRKFGKKYDLDFKLMLDKNQKMKKQLSATHTPHIFVVRKADNKVLYSGKLDNSFENIGRRRQVITEHFLRDALENILHNKHVSPAKTDAVGCFIIE